MATVMHFEKFGIRVAAGQTAARPGIRAGYGSAGYGSAVTVSLPRAIACRAIADQASRSGAPVG
jgi:hypothetical protein